MSNLHITVIYRSLVVAAAVSWQSACVQLPDNKATSVEHDATIPQCNDPYADADGDGDVDNDDLLLFQACFTGTDNVIPANRLTECGCFDRPDIGLPHGDGDVDDYDLRMFERCVSGPGIPADPACDDPTTIPILLDTSLSKLTARDGQSVQIGYHVSSPIKQDVQLVCTLVGADDRPITDTWNDATIPLTEGSNWYYRDFVVNLPPTGTAGTFDVHWELRQAGNTLQTQDRPGYLKILPGLSIRVPILVYHYFGSITPDDYWVTTDDFRRQMQVLKAYGYTTLFMQDLMDIRVGVASMPAKPILITIDDGVVNQITEVLPILADEAINFKATSFIIAGLMGMSDPKFPIMTWDQARMLQLSGHFDIQSHSMTHPNLTILTSEKLMSELAQSRQLIETELGKPARFFCYPYGDKNEAIKDAAWQAGYRAATQVGGGVELNCADKFSLRRVFMSSNVTLNYSPDRSQWFFMSLIKDPLPIPNIQAQTVSVLDPATGAPISSVLQGQQVKISVHALNSTLAANIIASLAMSTPGAGYSSHNGDAMLADITTTFNPGERIFEWIWQVPANAPTGTYDAQITFHDRPYLLRWHLSNWPGLVNVTAPPP